MYREMVPTSGQVLVDGVRVDRLRKGRVPPLRRSVGVVFQDFKLLASKSVWEERCFCAASYRCVVARDCALGTACARFGGAFAQESNVPERTFGR